MSLGFGLMLVFQVVLAIFLVAIILLQQGKGATAGASFGAGASSTVFGSRGSASFLSRTTSIAATLFLLNSMALAYFYGHAGEESSVLDQSLIGSGVAEDQKSGNTQGLPNDVPSIQD
mgnify:FL=1